MSGVRPYLFLLLLLPSFLLGQTNSGYVKVDSATDADLANQTAVELINKANSSAVTNPVKSNKLATAALEKSIATGDRRSQYQSYNTLATLYFNAGNYAGAIKYFEMAAAGFASLNDPKNKAYSEKYMNLARAKLKDLEEYEKKRTYANTTKVNKSKIYKKDEILKQRAAVLDKSNPEIIDIYKELGDYYLELNDTLQASAYLTEGAKVNLLNASDHVVLSNASSYNWSFNAMGKYDDNIRFQNGVLAEGRKRGNDEIVGLASHNLGATYVATQQPVLAIPFLKQSIYLAVKDNNIDQKQKSVKELSKAYEKLGQYDKALQVIKDYLKTLDSVQNAHDMNAEANLALNKEFAKQEARIQKLIQSQKQKETDLKRQQNILWGLAGALALFGLLTWLLVRNIRQKQKANMQIKLQSLRAQMNPHFIFNSLNSVNNFISKNDERSANRYLSDFSTLMRSVLKNSDQDFVSLETEIQTLRIYLDLEHFRFGEKFDYTLEVASDIDPNLVQVPPMLIQPYIENAIWHGLRYKEDKGKLEVKFYTENDKLYCTVKDNGIGRDRSAALKTDNQKSYQSTGIKNTKERIEILNKLHGTKLHISIFDLAENGNASGTMARISIPFIMQLEEV